MYKLILVFRTGRNVLIALFSSLWVFLFLSFFGEILWLLKRQETEFLSSEGVEPSFSYLELGYAFTRIGVCWLVLVIGFWAFVAANKLWPIKGKPKAEQNNK